MIERGHADLNCAIGCNFSCRDCSHVAPINDRWFMTPAMVERDLGELAKVVHFQKIQMVGGEPTLNKDLPEIMRMARKSGIAREVMVITNGSLLKRMPDEFWEELDLLQLSIYPTLEKDIPAFAKAKCAEYGKPYYETVFTHFYHQFRAVPNDGAHFSTCSWKSDCFSIHDGHFALCPQSLFFPEKFMGLEQFVDCLPIAGITEEKLDAFLNRKEPLNACRMCMANELKSRPWAEAKRSEWMEKSKSI